MLTEAPANRSSYGWEGSELPIVALELCDVTKLYRPTSGAPVVALDQVSLKVPMGQVTGVVGPSGAGKTTFLRLLAGLRSPTAGTIHRHGAVALIPSRLPWHQSVRAVLHGAHLRHTREGAEERTSHSLATSGLQERAATPAAMLDRGTQWWLQLSVALAGDPSVLLADDPPPEALTERLRGWAASTGKALVVATDQMLPAAPACDHLLYLRNGRMVGGPAPEPLRRRPAPQGYAIRIQGHLGERWTRWFDGLKINNLPEGESLIIGPMVDQAALHGVLAKVRDLGLPLLSVVPLESPDR